MKIFENFDLTNYNSYNIKSICSKAYFPENERDIINFFKINKTYNVLGSGYNIILSKEYYQTPFLILNNTFNTISFEQGEIVAEAGSSMYDISLFALSKSLSGLEIFYDIPSSLGGAIVMNAGAGGEEIKDVLTKVRFLNLKSLQIQELTTTEINFEYRNSFFQKNKNTIILKAWLKLNKGSKTQIKDKMDIIKKTRWQKQPREFPNAGSVFKRPSGYYVGQIMEELELKGYEYGGAQISEKHGGFIVNHNNATGKDILSLIELINNKVFENYGFYLEIEQRII